ncbi:MAG: PLP-dependent aspartate aminotransferase family protein [Gammaproteobacteria bacterium]|nr:PLP-dependent aspartate aminotransferase family protein [Gammaproteobacteria bacterium]MDH4254356.1 PLP-dependent aspartate aminotransferase family protein [Gammaproteobacteria bacterium]MDH5309373.1 PLP-dependent aspartate aminotransferase family protein [Gammaproteobacteria bacterium]
MGFRTKQIHAGVTPDPTTGAILTPIYQSTTFVQESVDSYLAKGFSYSRSGNPTVRALEKKLTVLEGGADTTCYGTGMSAVSCTMLAFLNAGEHAVISDVAYGGTYRLCTKVLTRFGVEFSFADTSNPADVKKHVRKNTKLFLTETPANPTMKCSDIAAISALAKDAGAVHVVDNTFLTPYYQRPLELGADLSLHSTTKYFDGHNATVGGAVVARTAELDEKLRFIQNSTGSIMSPMVAWLTLQGTKTLAVRMDQQSASALAIARFLEQHPKVLQVAYPGLESFPQHELSKRQASGFGAMMWFEVKGGVKAGKKLMDSIGVWTLAENLGSVESLITHPVTMTHSAVEPAERKRVGITDGLVRLSVGLEDTDDLIGALDQALAAV